MAEHRRAVKNMDPKNGIAMHVQKTARAIDWQEARIFVKEENWEEEGFSKPLRSSKEDQ